MEGALEEMMMKITIDIIMLGPLVDDIVTSNLNGTSVVIVYRSSRSKRDRKS